MSTPADARGVLEGILEHKRQEIAQLKRRPRPAPGPPPRPLGLRRAPGEPLRLICEIKQRSPSAGALDQTLSVVQRAQRYAAHGADMLSVLTDAQFFGGSFEHISQIRKEALATPILCKDFVLDPVQLDWARASGADAVLLIVRCVGAQLSQLLDATRQRGLQALVEVTSEAEAAQALSAGATLIGVNARDLDTLKVDVARAARVLGSLPPQVVCAHLSGLKRGADVAQVAAGRADAALIGETLMRLADPGPLLAELRAAAGAAQPSAVARAAPR